MTQQSGVVARPAGRDATRAVLAAVVAAALGFGGLATGAAAAHSTASPQLPRSVPGGTSSFINSPVKAVGTTPAGVTMTVEKTVIGHARVASAGVLPTDPAAPADEFLIPVNAKAAPGINDLYKDFDVTANAWSDILTLKFTFSRPVRNPRLHVAGTGGAVADSQGNEEYYWAGLELVGGAPVRPTFSNAAGFPGYTVTNTSVLPTRIYSPKSTTCGVVYTCGSVQLNGTLTSFSVKVRARNVRTGVTAGDQFFWGVFRVSLDEDDSDAPASYGAASHVVGDTFLGTDGTPDHMETVSFLPRQLAADVDDDDALPRNAAITSTGQSYTLRVPLNATANSTLSGWIDFDRNGKFDEGERAQAAVAPADTSKILTWTPPANVTEGRAWVRLRLGNAAEQVAVPTGWADSGEVEDHQVSIGPHRLAQPAECSKKSKNPLCRLPGRIKGGKHHSADAGQDRKRVISGSYTPRKSKQD